jgi:uncharacterized protein (TIGR04222 family)
MLAGGRTRFGETVLARLLARGAITIGQDGFRCHSIAASPSAAAERDVLSLPSPFKWKAVREMLAGAAVQLEQRLVDQGLLMEQGEARQLGLYATIPLVLLIGFGLIKVVIGMGRDRPVGFLVAFIVATVVVALVRLFRIDRRTRAGISAVSEARLRADRLRRASTEAETGMAVALFGTAILIGSPIADLHGFRRQTGDSSGGGGCGGGGSSDGGSGCGGGGCGGCGG